MDPSFVLASWAGGLAAGMVLVALWRVVGPGYTRLASAVTLLFGIPAAIAVAGPFAWTGCALVLLAGVLARRPPVVTVLAALGAVTFTVAAALDGRTLLAVSGAVFLGGVASEMMLGHWYLVDPRLPRHALRTLAVIGAGGAALDAAGVVALGGLRWDPADAVMGWAFVTLAVTTLALMVAVWFALGERGYAGVMAATGLSYLALLTAIGAAVLGRMLVG